MKNSKIKTVTYFTLLVSLVLGGMLLFTSCDLTGQSTGSLKVVISDETTSKSLNPTPDLDMTIESYVVTLTKSDTTLSFSLDSTGSSYTVDALSAGSWTLEIAGKNSDGTIVAEIDGGSTTVGIQRGVVSTVTATMVPCSGQGTLSLDISLTGDSGQLSSPTITIELTDTEGNAVDLTTSSYSIDSTISLSVPAGWYTANLQLMDGASLIDTHEFFPRIAEGYTTSYSTSFEISTYAVGDRGPAGGYIFYAFDDTSLIDAIGSYDATISGAVRASIGGNSGLHFDGVDDYAEVDTTIDSMPGVFEAKVYVSSSVPDATRVGIIAGNWMQDDANTDTVGWEIYTYGKPRLYWNNGELNYLFSYDVRQDKWIYLKFVRGTDRIHLYVDDTTADGSTLREITSYTGSGTGTDLTLSDTGRNLRIGGDYPSTRQPFKGYISDVKIYDDSDNLVLYYPMKRYMEAAPDDLHLLEDGTVTCDATETDYDADTTTDTFIYGYIPGELGPTESIPDTEYRNIGSGALETESIVNTLGTTVMSTDIYAARMCTLLDMNGFDDWFLPSLNEMHAMLANLHDHYNPRSTFVVDDSYWSSTSGESDPSWYAYGQVFTSDYETSTDDSELCNSYTYRVRPARIF